MTIKGVSGNWNVKAEVYEKSGSVNINNNTSVVRVDLYVGRNAGQSTSYYQGTFSGSISVNGVAQSFSGSANQSNVAGGEYRYTGVTKDFIVTHNADGSKTVPVSFSWSANFSPTSASASGNLKLTTIARKTDCPSLTGFIKSSYNLTLSPKSTSFTHSLKVVFGNLIKWLQADGTLGDSEYKFSSRSPLITLPASFYSQFSGYEGVGTFYLYTYNGNTNLGYNTNTLRAQCNPAYKPTITSYTIQDINQSTLDITNEPNDLIQNASTAYIALVLSAGDADDPVVTITSKTINNIVMTSSNITITEVNTNTFIVNLINNRNITNTITITADGVLIPYIKPTLNIESIKRPEPTGSDVDVDYSGNFFTGRFIGSHNTTPNLVVDDDISLDDLRFSFPNNLYEDIEETEHTTDIIVTDEFKIVETFVLSGGLGGDCYTGVVLTSLPDSESTTYFPLYLAVGTSDGQGGYTYTVNTNITQMSSTGSDFGVITNIYSDENVYQYLSKVVDQEAIQNELTISWSYREKDAQQWTAGGTLTPTINTNDNTFDGNETLDDIFNYQKQYDFQFILEDNINTVILYGSVSRGLPIFWWSNDAVHFLEDIYIRDFNFSEPYSYNELDTGCRWLDGKTIYRKAYLINSISTLNTDEWIDTGITSSSIANIINIYGFYNIGLGTVPINFHNNINTTYSVLTYVNTSQTNAKIGVKTGMAISNGCVIIEYTKTQNANQ